MDIAAILKWLESTSLANEIREGLYLFPFLESIHVVGLALVFGTIVVIDLRLLGLASSNRTFNRVASDVLKWTWTGFVTTVITGSLMFITNADVYFHNIYFQMKILLLALSGVNMAAFEFTARKTVAQWDAAPSAPRAGRIVATVSLALWISVIFTGRLIGFRTSHATKAPPPAEVNLDDLFK